MMEFKRLLNGNIVLDGVLWGPNPDRAIRVRNKIEDTVLLNIKVDGNYYYPMAVDKAAADHYAIIPREQTSW